MDLMKPTISRVQIQLVQDGNTMGTTEDLERLEVTLETQDFENHFAVIRTEGWSFDSPDELSRQIGILVDSIEIAKKRIGGSNEDVAPNSTASSTLASQILD